jgi:hypothetical protein
VNADPKMLSVSSPPGTSNKFSPPAADDRGEQAAEQPHADSLQIWLLRIRALLIVTLCATFGVLLVILPWMPQWTDNPLLLSVPQLREIIGTGFFRGVVSGLGMLDLWLGFWEAIHYHEGPKNSSQ